MKNIYALIFCLLAMPAVTFAADEKEKQPERIADSWSMTPKDGHGAEFREALAAHMEFRSSKNDPREWHVYRPVTGDKTNDYIVRACCFEWADQDSYTEWANKETQKHFGETVHPHVASYNHNFTVTDNENSHWPKGTIANFVGVTSIKVKNGSNGKIKRAIKAMSKVALDNKWGHAWSWSYPISGETDLSLAIPFENYASMAPLDESFYDFVVRVLKSEEEAGKLFEDYSGSIESSSYHIYRHDKEVSMSSEKE